LLADSTDLKLLPRHEQAFESVWMDRPARPTWLHIDMDAIAYNVRRLKELVGADVSIMAVVKANAYGMGAVAVSTTALLNGASYLGVASINEAIELREAGITAPILVMGYTPAWAAALAIRYDITVNFYDIEVMQAFNRVAAEMNSKIKAHIKIDTGMGRLGMLPNEVSLFFRAASQLKHIEVEGIFTHFSSADSDNAYTNYQIETFEKTINPLLAAGFQFKYIHAANSAGLLRFPNGLFNMVRPGIAMYGFEPGPRCPLPEDFKPALTWKTTIAQVKRLPPNSYVGYGKTYHTRSEERIAVIPVGYADGFRRAPKTWAHVLVHGQKAPIIGRVSMDQTMINISEIDEVRIGDEVVLIGKQGEEEITVESAAENLGTINYELISTILARVPRVK
jgi:alanine racemase